MKRILLPTDLSALSGFAYDLAHKLTARTDAGIHAFSVIPAPPRAVYDETGYIKDDGTIDYSDWYRRKEEMEKRLAEWASDKKDVVRTEVKIGRVREDIVAYADRHKMDLIVMGTAGAAGLDEMVRLTTTEYVVNHASVSTMSLKCDRSDLAFEDILIIGDFNEDKPQELDALKSIQKAFDSRLHLLEINTRENFEATPRSREKMARFAEINDLGKVEMHIYNAREVERGIVEFCEESGIDFIAIGTYQRSSWSRLFNYSISEEAVNHIHQPMLCFPLK